MMRLPPTTISLAMTEVKDFEHHQRFRKYLATEDARVRLPNEFPLSPYTARCNEDVLLEPLDADEAMNVQDETSGHDEPNSGLLCLRPRRLPKVPQPEDMNSYDSSNQSRSMESSSGSFQPPPPSAWAVHPVPSNTVRLPPPLFSHRAGRVSAGDPLPAPSSNTGPLLSGNESIFGPPVTPPRASSLQDDLASTPSAAPTTLPVSGRGRFLRSAVRFVEHYVHSPSARSPSPTRMRPSFSTPSLEERAERLIGAPMITDARLRIYNDSQPAISQPQTPQNLPDARHQSRLQGSYTAPVLRVTPAQGYHTGTIRGRHNRPRSPSGLSTPGFRGLYGGIENSDENLLVEAASRLFDLHDNESIDDGEA